MRGILYLIAVILIIGWAISFIGGMVTGGLIHLILVVALILILINLLSGGRTRV